jgi:hypothetical protein
MIPYYLTRTETGFGSGLSTNLIITSDTVPTEVNDSKSLHYYEQQIPGGYTSIYKYGSSGARKISFKLEIADFNDDVGLGLKLSQFDMLRRPEVNITTAGVDFTKSFPESPTGGATLTGEASLLTQRYKPFFSNPYVLYYNSIFNTVPLPFQVLKCDWVSSKPNKMGKPQYAVIDFELVQMEDHPLSATEDKAKKALSMIGALGQSVPNLIKSLKNSKGRENKYKNKTSKLGF